MADEEIVEARGFSKFCSRTRAASERREILARGFDNEDGKDHSVGIIDVEHEADDESEEEPLGQGASGARLVPIPEEKRDGERGVRVGPGGIEIHVDGKRAGPPDRNGSEKRPTLVDVPARETESEEQSEKTVNGRGERHSHTVGSGETVSRNGRTQGACE